MPTYKREFDLRGQRIMDTYPQLLQYDSPSQSFYNGQGAYQDLFISASYSPVDPDYSASVSNEFNTTTSSWSRNSINSISASWASRSLWSTTSSYASKSFYAVSASWASQSLSASWSPGGASSVSASWASQSLSASYLIWSPNNGSASWAQTASYAPGTTFSGTSSYISSSATFDWQVYQLTALNAITCSYAYTSSYSDEFTINGNLNVNGITYFSNSAFITPQGYLSCNAINIIGNIAGDTLVADTNLVSNGDASVTGKLECYGGITGSLQGTASYADKSFSATSASWASSSFSATSASWASKSLYSIASFSASWADQSGHAIFADTASFSIVTQLTQSNITQSTANYASSSLSSSWASSSLSASVATALYTGNASLDSTQNYFSTPITAAADLYVGNSSQMHVGTYGDISTTGYITAASITGSLLGTASWSNNSLTASYITSSNIKGSVTAFSASWASASISASYAPVQPSYSASVSTQFGTKQPNLVTGNTYTITSSWSNNAKTASLATAVTTTGVTDGTNYNVALVNGNSIDFDGNLLLTYTPNTGILYVNNIQTTDIAATSVTASLFGTSSWANYVVHGDTSDTASYISSSAIFDKQVYQLTASWASRSLTATSASYASRSTTASWADAANATLVTGTTYPITASWSVNTVNGGSGVTPGNYYDISVTFASSSISASWASRSLWSTTSSYASASTTATSASWASQSLSSLYSSASFSASWASSSFNATSASWSSASLIATSASWSSRSFAATSASWTSQSLSSSFATNANTASYISQSIYFPTTINNYFPFWQNNTLSTSSFISSSGNSIISSVPITASLQGLATTAMWASQSLSASYLIYSANNGTASYAMNAMNAGNTNTNSASYVSGSNSLIVNLSSSIITASAYYNYMPYTTVYTSSTKWITCSFDAPNQYVTLSGSGAGTISFTSSNHPTIGNFADVILFISNSMSDAPTLSFPSNWLCMNGLWPLSITIGSSAVIWLRGYDTHTVIGTYHENLI